MRFDGQSFVFDDEIYMGAVMEDQIKLRGGIVRGYVAKNTAYVVYRLNAESHSKRDAAANNKLQGLSNTNIITVKEFYEMIRKKD